MRKIHLIFAIGLVAVAVLIRVEQWLPNVAPVAALALWAGANYRGKTAWLMPLAAMIAADAVIGFYNGFIMAAVYGSFVLITWLGQWLKGEVRATRVLLGSLGASALFYLVTNAAVWWFSGMYEHTVSGLVLSYYLAIPFFRNTIFGNLAYSSAIFLVWSLVLILYRADVMARNKKEALLTGALTLK